jgi:hypothetical protein
MKVRFAEEQGWVSKSVKGKRRSFASLKMTRSWSKRWLIPPWPTAGQDGAPTFAGSNSPGGGDKILERAIVNPTQANDGLEWATLST